VNVLIRPAKDKRKRASNTLQQSSEQPSGTAGYSRPHEPTGARATGPLRAQKLAAVGQTAALLI